MPEQIAQRVEPVSETPTETSNARSSSEPTIETHEISERPPSLRDNYFAEMFEIGEAKTHFAMPTLLKEINDFVLSEFKRQSLEDNVENYKEVVEHYLKKLNLPEDIDQYARTEKVHELMMIDSKLLKLAKEKEELLSKPISELNSKQLKDRIEGK